MKTSRVFFLGPDGTFCHEAARRAFPDTASVVPCASISGVFEAVSADPDSHGVVPIENSIEGSVNLTLESLLEFEALTLSGEIVVEVEHCLLSDGTLASIEVVESHPHALPQCKRWLQQYLPNAAQIPVASTALAAQRAHGHPTRAAVASALASELNGVPILARGIQDRARNATRFLVLGHEVSARTGADKTSIVFGAPHEKGALHRVLGIFARHDINLSRIESRPAADEMWQYVFFADLEGHRDDANVHRALDELTTVSPTLRVLGSYPRA